MKRSAENIRMNLFRCLYMALLLCIAGCSQDEPNGIDPSTSVKLHIAVICPKEKSSIWKSTANWALDNISKAQIGQDRRISLDIEWIDEGDSNLTEKVSSIAKGGGYDLIIGPYSSAKAYQVSQQVQGKIPLLLPSVTSTEMQRIYGGHNGVWFFSQSDITQCEILLTQAKLKGNGNVALITTNDAYGQSFNDWFTYQAIELSLTVDEIFICQNESDISNAVRRLNGQTNWHRKSVILAPSALSYVVAFDGEIGKIKAKLKPHEYLMFPEVLCSDIVNSSGAKGSLRNMIYEGVSPSADPRSGWTTAYVGKFGAEPYAGEAQLYDALMLSAFAIHSRQESESLNEAIMRVVDGRDGSVCEGWTAADLQKTFSRLVNESNPDIRGVTGEWIWDKKFHNTVSGTYYSHWIYADDKFSTLEYLTLNGENGSISSVQAWEWNSTHQQSFDPNQKDFTYPVLNDKFAVVVGASDTWVNYRHQADALAFYQMLKSHGYDDDHIILIMEDNIANHPNNARPGDIRVTTDGENLYHDVKVDYHLSDISVADLSDIMTGKSSEELKEVISPTANDNIIMFWCGHGSRNTLMWGSGAYVYGDDMKQLISGLNTENRYRKLMFVLDACYSGTIGEACEGIPGVLVFTAAHSNESSKADVFDRDLNVWLSNGFTRTFRDEVTANPDITLRELYYKTVRGTKGSHPRIYNSSNYGNMHHETLRDFL